MIAHFLLTFHNFMKFKGGFFLLIQNIGVICANKTWDCNYHHFYIFNISYMLFGLAVAGVRAGTYHVQEFLPVQITTLCRMSYLNNVSVTILDNIVLPCTHFENVKTLLTKRKASAYNETCSLL